MWRKTGSYLLTAVAVVTAAALAQPSAAAATPKAPALSGTVVISGSTTGYVEVTVPKQAVLPAGLGADAVAAIRITGGGGFAGFALATNEADGPLIVGGHAPASAPTPERPEVLAVNYGSGEFGNDFTIPAGRYRLYLITGGKPTTVTLKLRGLTGKSSFKPTVPTRAVVQGGPLAAATSAEQVGGIYSGGHTAQLTTPFLQFYVNKLDAEVHTETAYRPCFFIGRPTGPMPYNPACASVEQQKVNFGQGTLFPVSDENLFGGAYYTWGGVLARVLGDADEITQEFGGGMAVTTASLIRGTDYSQVWLELNAPAKPATARPAANAPRKPSPTPAPAPGSASAVAAEQLPATGLPAPVLAVAPALLLAAAAARRSNQR